MINKPMSRYYQLVSNTFLFALGNFGSKFLVFLLVPLYTNALSTGEYGISEILVTGTNLIIPFISLSIQDATLRFALDKSNKKGEVIKNTIVILAFGSGVAFLLLPLIKLYKPLTEWAFFFIAISISYMIRNAFSVYIKAIGKSKLFAIDSIIYTAELMISNILFLSVLKLGMRGYFYAILVSSILSICYLTICGGIIRSFIESTVNKKMMIEMIRFSLPMVLNNVSWWIINSSDKVMIERYMTAGDSGIYSVAAKMPSLIAAVTNIFNQAWVISSVSEYDSTRDTKFFSNTFKCFNAVIIIFAAGIISIIKPFMQIYVGVDFVSCWRYVPLLLLGSIFQSYATFFGAIYTSAKKNVSVMMTTFLAAGINILLNIVLIKAIGIHGAVIATAIAYLLVFIFRMFDSLRYIRFDIDLLQVGLSIFILTIQCLISILDWHSYLLSAVCIISLLLINHSTLIMLLNKILHRFKKCKQ